MGNEKVLYGDDDGFVHYVDGLPRLLTDEEAKAGAAASIAAADAALARGSSHDLRFALRIYLSRKDIASVSDKIVACGDAALAKGDLLLAREAYRFAASPEQWQT